MPYKYKTERLVLNFSLKETTRSFFLLMLLKCYFKAFFFFFWLFSLEAEGLLFSVGICLIACQKQSWITEKVSVEQKKLNFHKRIIFSFKLILHFSRKMSIKIFVSKVCHLPKQYYYLKCKESQCVNNGPQEKKHVIKDHEERRDSSLRNLVNRKQIVFMHLKRLLYIIGLNFGDI